MMDYGCVEAQFRSLVTAFVVACVLLAFSVAMLFNATIMVGFTNYTYYRKIPTTCCTVLASGGESLINSGAWCDIWGDVEP